MEYIRWEGLPWEYVQKAYDEGHYIEAIQILHGFIENQLQELLMLVGAVKFDTDIKNTWDIANQISFLNCLKSLYIIGQFNQKEFNDLLNLNSARNKIIHKIFFSSRYNKESYKGYPKKKFDNIFKKSIKAIELIYNKIEQFV